MNIVENLEALLAAVILGQCVLTISLLAIKKDPQPIYAPLMVFFAAFIINSLGTMLDIFPFTAANTFFKYACDVFAYISLLLLSPALWLYVRNITSPSLIHWKKRDVWHLAPFFIGLGVAALLLSLPYSMLAQIFGDGTGPSTPLLITAALSLYILMVTWVIQSVCYFFVIIRQLIRHKQTLKHYFSSTEDRELLWIYCVSSLMICALLIAVLNMFTDSIDHISYVVDILDLCLILVLSHWGLRQGSFMTENALGFTVEPNDSAQKVTKVVVKYEKSALSEAHIDRIEANIHKVMQNDKLYLNPNLSLGDLAKAVSEPANYVSQTLNGRLGDTFFDFINTQRIQDALPLLNHENKTILDIAYDVGFNSRSSFYKAFKQKTGLTPTTYKQQMQETQSK